MSTLPEQFSAARKSQVEAQINFFQNYASTAVQNAEKLLALNLSTTRASMEKSSAVVRQLLAVQDPRDLFALTTQTQENFESLLAYGRELFSIASDSQATLLKQAVPVIAPSVPQAPAMVPAEAPKAKAAPKAVVAEPLPQTAPAAPAPVKAKPAAKVAVAEGPATPAAAAPAPVAAAPAVVTSLKAVQAAPPAAEPKQLDMLAPKAKKKK